MLLPTNIVEIKLFGFLKNTDNILDDSPSFRSSSKRSLSTETNAISMPEKKAEKAIVIKR